MFPGWPRQIVAPVRERAAGALVGLGVRPVALTIAGVVLAGVSGWLFYWGLFRAAAAVLALSGLCDFLDGAVARTGANVTHFGAFLDSTADRVSDAAVLGGILLYYSSCGADRYVALAFAAIAGSFLVSYTRARAESIVAGCEVGLFQRPERIILTVIAGLSGLMGIALWILAIASCATAVQRVLYVRRCLADDGGQQPANGSGDRRRS